MKQAKVAVCHFIKHALIIAVQRVLLNPKKIIWVRFSLILTIHWSCCS